MIPTIQGFRMLSPFPIDSRYVVEYYEDLADVYLPYEGLIVYVRDEQSFYSFKKNEWLKLIDFEILHRESRTVIEEEGAISVNSVYSEDVLVFIDGLYISQDHYHAYPDRIEFSEERFPDGLSIGQEVCVIWTEVLDISVVPQQVKNNKKTKKTSKKKVKK